MTLCILSAALLRYSLLLVYTERALAADGGILTLEEAPAIIIPRREAMDLGQPAPLATRQKGTRLQAAFSLLAAAIGASAGAVPFRGTDSKAARSGRIYRSRKERADYYFRPCRNDEMRGSGRYR